MKKTILDLSENKAYPLQVDSAISFTPFIEYLKRKVKEESTVKAALYKNALKEFEKQDLDKADLSLDNIHQYERLFEHMYACLSPTLATEDELAWGLCFPLQPVTFYGTSSMYQLLENKQNGHDAYVASKTPEEHHQERLQLVYTFILKKLYNFNPSAKTYQFHAGIKTDTGLLGFYHVNINSDFIAVKAKKVLPQFTVRELQEYLADELGLEKLQRLLPLDLFEFRGISVLTVSDVTALQAVENIKKVRLTRTPGAEEASYAEVIQSLKTLVQNSNIHFDLFPFVRVNNKMVYGYVKGGSGVLFSVWGEQTLSPETFQQYAEGYAANPNSFYSPDILEESKEMFPWLDKFVVLNIRSLALIPVFYDHVVVGVLGMHTWLDETFDEKTLALLEPAIAPIAQLLQLYIDEFNLEIENIIKEKYTSIQPAVQWKFNEAAWHHLHDKKKHLPVRSESISFTNVYPFYGAIDIKNSTTERNNASKADLELHLTMLQEIFQFLKPDDQSSLLEEMMFNCKKWDNILKEGTLNTTEENNLNIFLKEETSEYLKHIVQTRSETKKVIEPYLQAISASNGEVYKNRQALEVSMQMINTAVNNYFEAEKEKLQLSYPCYFEKFRTDGVEYDIYIGQSIAPDKPFNNFHLKNLRLWQLSSMAHVAKMMGQLLPHMPVKLATTHLIFIHNHTIDISFRADERKFDVEGAYNIRYQMIKKRIDKVLIRGTQERLTQPDKLALIYFNKRDIEDYLPFVKYLQETGVLHGDTEDLDLEDLQGLSGLKALRVTLL
jgi:hypothetical protein